MKLLRDNFPNAHIEILGYKRIVALAEKRFYADATRSIDYAPLSRFFARDSELAAELVTYFGSLRSDSELSFRSGRNLCGECETLWRRDGSLRGSPKFDGREHAAYQLARPLQELGLTLADPAAFLFPNESDRDAANGISWSRQSSNRRDSSRKWERNEELADRELDRAWRTRAARGTRLVVVGGEADEKQISQLRGLWTDKAGGAIRDQSSVAASRGDPGGCCLCRSRQRYFTFGRGCGREMHFAFWSDRSRGLGAGK